MGRRRRRRRGGLFRRIGRALSRVGRAVGRAVRGVTSGIGKAVRGVTDAVGITKKKSAPKAPPPSSSVTQSPPIASSTGLQSSTQSSGKVDPGIIAMRRGKSTSTVPPSVVQFVGKDRKEEMMNVFGGIDKEYSAYEKPPLSKCISIDADVTWGHRDLPAVLIDWSDYLDDDEKKRFKFWKVLQWIPGKDGDEIETPPRQRVLQPVDWFKKFVDAADYREKDNSSKKGRTNSNQKRRSRSMSNPRRKPKKVQTSGLIPHRGHFHKKIKGKRGRGPIVRNLKAYRKEQQVQRRRTKSVKRDNRRRQVKRTNRSRSFLSILRGKSGRFRRRRGRR